MSAPAKITSDDRPKKISEVLSWITAHPDVDPSVLAPYPKQRAAERRAALRALGVLATPAAFEVLSAYAREGYSDVDLDELHKMWGNFDRREFAATMFRPSAWTLNLGSAESLEGIDAVANLTSLDVIFLGEADLAPLAECISLQRLKIISNVEPSVTSVEPLAHLPQLRTLKLSSVTRNAELSMLAGMALTELQISLDGADGSFLQSLSKLRTLILSGGSSPDDDGAPREKWEPEPIPAHPNLPEVVFALARSGVDVIVYKHERAWVTQLVEDAEATEDISVDKVAGRFSLTTKSASREQLRTRMRLNTLVS